MCRIMRHLVIKLELLAPGEVFCISRHLARSLVKHSELLIKIQNVNIVRQKFLFENGPSKQIMNIGYFRTPKPLHLMSGVPICLSAPHVTSVDE